MNYKLIDNNKEVVANIAMVGDLWWFSYTYYGGRIGSRYPLPRTTRIVHYNQDVTKLVPFFRDKKYKDKLVLLED